MLRFYLELNTVAKTALVSDKHLITYEELEVNTNLLDKLYNRLNQYKVDEFIVVLNGVLSDTKFNNSYSVYDTPVGNKLYTCYVSKTDVDKLAYLTKVLNIPEFKIFDKLGYYLTIKNGTSIFVDSIGTAYSCITLSDKILDVNYNRYAVLEKIILNSYNKYNADNIINVCNCPCPNLLQLYDNIDGLTDEILTTLSIFAYTNLKISETFKLNISSLDIDYSVPTADENNPLMYEQQFSEKDFTKVEDSKVLNENSILIDDDENIVKEVKKVEKKRKNVKKDAEKQKIKEKYPKKSGNKVLKILSTLFIVISIIFFVGVHLIYVKYNSDVGTLTTENVQLNNGISILTEQYDDYMYLTESTIKNNLSDLYNKIVSIDTNVQLHTVEFELNSFNVSYISTNESEFDKLSSTLEENFTILSAETSEELIDGKNSYIFTFSIQY